VRKRKYSVYLGSAIEYYLWIAACAGMTDVVLSLMWVRLSNNNCELMRGDRRTAVISLGLVRYGGFESLSDVHKIDRPPNTPYRSRLPL